GIPNILELTYFDIQEFAMKVLYVLAKTAPGTRHLAMTIHGAGFGLDEIEAFLAQFNGYLRVIQNGQFPPSLEKITIIDKDLARIRRLRQAFGENISHANFVSQTRSQGTYGLNKRLLNASLKSNQRSTRTFENEEIKLRAKPHVFVAMPF